MIGHLQGEVIFKGEHFVILDVGGVGYKVFLSLRSLSKIPQLGGELKLFCHLHVRENLLALYGFLNQEELKLFELVEGVSGIGPKAALQIASLGSLEKFKKAVLSQDEKFFKGVSGIGKKKIQKIILELTGKIRTPVPKAPKPKPERDEALEALLNLGFAPNLAREALKSVPREVRGTEERIKAALKVLGKP